MKTTNKLGWGVAVSGLLIAITPTWLLPVCEGLLELVNGKIIPMRCHYTANAEILIGGIAAVTGLLMVYAKETETYQRLSNLVIVLGVSTVIAPLYLLPTCAHPDMACNIGTKPALLLLGGLTILFGLIGSRPTKPELAGAV